MNQGKNGLVKRLICEIFKIRLEDHYLEESGQHLACWDGLTNKSHLHKPQEAVGGVGDGNQQKPTTLI